MYLKLKIPQLLCYLAFLGISLISVETLSQTKGAISGKVIDAELKTELPGATIQIRGTTEGTTSDIYGKYFLSLAPGTYVVEVRFLGYETFTREVTITDRLITLDFSLSADVGTLDEVVVTAQNLGQRSAINRQIRSNSIVNIVSKDKIESLPDQNAAESVGRLPGVAIQRNGGEGQKVAIRGLSPRFNSITINGERLPSSDANDRSFDLSALSSDAIQGIELFKSWTPNLEGDAIGGTVNFVTKKADKDWNGKFRYLHGYNGQQQEFGQHRINFDIGNRFFSDKLGVLLSANYQRADRSQDRFGGDYNVQADVNNQGIEETFTENINLEDRLETRYRYGATASIDYTFDRGDIRLFTNYSQTDRDQIRRRRRYRFDSRRQEYELTDNQTENVLIANTLSGKYIFKNQLEVTMNGSYSRTRITTPFNHSVRFRENSAFENTTENFPDINEIIGLARNDLSRTFLQRARSDEDNIDFDRYSSQVDLKLPIKLFRSITGKIQAGGKIRIDRRVRDLRRFQARETDQIVSIAGADDGSQFPDKNETQIFFSNFEGDFVANSFLDGDFFLGPGSGNVNGGHLSERLTNEFFR
ncbi:MAG: carboxypeptidase-like regulatory domain-containing protein, partial [Bacteroidota bacterium]